MSVMPSGRTSESTRATSSEPRNERFDSDQPFEHDSSLSLLGATGAFKYFNPTSAQYSWRGWHSVHDSSLPEHSSQQSWSADDEEPEGHIPARRKDDLLSFVWRSRDNRKGRHALLLRRGDRGEKQPHGSLQPTNTLSATLHGILALFTKFPYWDISWCIAIVYVVGSIVWVGNGFTVLLPQIGGGLSEDMQRATTWTGVAGASLFFVGSYLLFLEAVNANKSGCFGWAVECTLMGVRREAEIHPGDCEHHYHARDKHCHVQQDETYEDNPENSAYSEYVSNSRIATRVYGRPPPTSQDHLIPKAHYEADHCHTINWLWWPSWYELRTHFLHELGFIACSLQLFSGFLFWLSKFITLPVVKKQLTQPAVDSANWVPQIVGCVGFIIASLLFMLETQYKWYIPAPRILGWHVGFWKLLGCVGFLLSAILGLLGEHGSSTAEKQSAIASFWGSWTILIGSVVQWYESLDKFPILDEGTSRYSEWNEKFIEHDKQQRGQDQA